MKRTLLYQGARNEAEAMREQPSGEIAHLVVDDKTLGSGRSAPL